MKTQTTQSAVVARFGSSHGYRFDGDTVFINASFHAEHHADAGRSWSLRLVSGDVSNGHVIAEAGLPPLAELTGAVENFEVAAQALPPAGRSFHTLSLVLVARDAAGTEEIHDHVTYPLDQAFLQPRLTGGLGFWFEDDEIILDLDGIENPRDTANLSGSLSLEVWALDRAYTGGRFQGQPVAGALLGQLAGGQSWQPGALHLRATKPAAGSHIAIMLREWNGSAYVTRDFVSFNPAPAAALATPVVETTASAPVAEAAPVAAAAAAETAAPKAAAKAAKPASSPAKARSASASASTRVSVNTASAAEIASVKGLNKTVASEIVKARPFASLTDLTQVKGLGPKTLEKIKSFLKL